MRYIFRIDSNQHVELFIEDDQGQVVRKFSEVWTTKEACRHLGRSRRQLYRHIQRRWLNPIARFSGEFFFDPAEIQRLPKQSQPTRSLPPSWATLFPDYEMRTLHFERDRDLILSRVLERGSWRQVALVCKKYSHAARVSFLKSQGSRLLSDRAFHLWNWLWKANGADSKTPWRKAGLALGGIA